MHKAVVHVPVTRIGWCFVSIGGEGLRYSPCGHLAGEIRYRIVSILPMGSRGKRYSMMRSDLALMEVL